MSSFPSLAAAVHACPGAARLLLSCVPRFRLRGAVGASLRTGRPRVERGSGRAPQVLASSAFRRPHDFCRWRTSPAPRAVGLSHSVRSGTL